VGGIINASMVVMDQAGVFEQHFPRSAHLYEVRRYLAETIAANFGMRSLPIPTNRAPDVETCVRKLLTNSPGDTQLYLVLCRVASRLPAVRARALYEELTNESTPEPARSLAKGGLAELGRLGTTPDIMFSALDGRAVSLANLRGKVVLIDFWSTTCAPCVQEMPDLKRLQAKYQMQDLELVGISLDSDRQALQRYIEKAQISWPQFYDPAGPTNRLAQEFGIASIPVEWLIDRHGVLRELNARENQEAKVQTLLHEP
jgi:thiol-disulfide isomerase/thioredoxin